MRSFIYRGSDRRGPYPSGVCKCGAETTCKIGNCFVCSVCQWHNKKAVKEKKVA